MNLHELETQVPFQWAHHYVQVDARCWQEMCTAANSAHVAYLIRLASVIEETTWDYKLFF